MEELGINVNGIIYFPLSVDVRVKQLARIDLTAKQVLEFQSKKLSEQEQKNELVLCMKSFEHFCTYYVQTFDPRLTPSRKPFILYDYQKEKAATIIASIRAGTNLLLEKSRDTGASWLIMAVLTWFWLFEQNFHALVGSRVEDLVDDGTVNSLLGKTDFIIEHLPAWMKRLIPYDEKKCRKALQRSTYEGSLLRGESANKNFGRGPRAKVVYVDEFAYVEEDQAIWTAISETAPCKIVSSTPAGEFNKFAMLRFSGSMAVVTFHWTQNPFKTWAWYIKKKEESDPREIASELDIDYKASAGQLALPELRRNKAMLVIPAFELNPAKFRFDMGLDYGTSNPTSVHVYAIARTKVAGDLFPRIYSVWEFYKPSDIDEVSKAIKGCPYYKFVQHIWADPSVFFNNQTGDAGQGTTNTAILFKRYGGVRLSSGKRGDVYPMEQLHLMWKDPGNPYFQIFETCANQVREFEGLQKQKQTSLAAQKKNLPEKLLDKDNHSWDDFKYFFNSTFDAPVEQEITQQDGWEQMRQDVAGLKDQKLKSLTMSHQRGRRMFTW